MDENLEVRSEAPEGANAGVQKLFPLDVTELRAELRITKGTREFRLAHIFAPIAQKDWEQFDRSMTVVRETGANADAQTTTIEGDGAGRLWREKIQTVEGYGELPADWKEKIPHNHRSRAIDALAQVFVIEETEERAGAYTLFIEDNTVLLEAGRNGVEYSRLLHKFKPVAESVLHKYRKNMLASQTVGRGKHARVVYPGRLGFLCGLYDELIESVEGYEPNDPARMDALHKRAAVEELLGNA